MTQPVSEGADWERQLPTWCAALYLKAQANPGRWTYRELPIGWRFSVLVSAAGRLHYRFRSPQYRDLTWTTFKAEARRLLGVLNAGHWKEREDERRLFWEVTYIAPAETPAPPEGAA